MKTFLYTILILLFVTGCASQAGLPSRTSPHTTAEANTRDPVQTSTITSTNNSDPEQKTTATQIPTSARVTATPLSENIPPTILDVYALPAWMRDAATTILVMVTDVSEATNELTFLNVDSGDRFSISVSPEVVTRYFWTPDGKAFGFVSRDFQEVYLVDILDGKVTQFAVDEQATSCLDDYEKNILPIVQKMNVFAASPTEKSFFCPEEPPYLAHREFVNDQNSIIVVEETKGGQKTNLTDPNDEMYDISFDWDQSQTRLAILQGPLENQDNRFVPGNKIIVFDMSLGQVAQSFAGSFCSLNWAPNGQMILVTETTDDACYSDALPSILNLEDGQKQQITAIAETHPAPYLASFQWSKDSSQLFYVYGLYNGRSDLCIFDLFSREIFCPTTNMDELNTYTIETYSVSPNEKYFAISYGSSCADCDDWGYPSSALMGSDGTHYHFIGREIYDDEMIQRPYPYYTILWKSAP